MSILEKIDEISKQIKYFWFYPKSKTKIELVLNNNSKSKSKPLLNKKLKNLNLDLVLLTVHYISSTNKLFPENVYITLNFYKLENNRFYKNNNFIPGKVFFKKQFLESKGFKLKFLKRIVKKFFFDGVKTPLLNWKYYSNL